MFLFIHLSILPVKSLEVNQTLSTQYLENASAKHSKMLKELKATLLHIQSTHLDLSKLLLESVERGASMVPIQFHSFSLFPQI